MIAWEIGYIIFATALFMFVAAKISRWAVANGIKGPESLAKRLAMTWRFSEVVLAVVVLYILWVPILHVGANSAWSVNGGGTAFFIAAAYTILFGGLYIGGSLFAGVTVPMGNQVAYLNDMDMKMRMEGLK